MGLIFQKTIYHKKFGNKWLTMVLFSMSGQSLHYADFFYNSMLNWIENVLLGCSLCHNWVEIWIEIRQQISAKQLVKSEVVLIYINRMTWGSQTISIKDVEIKCPRFWIWSIQSLRTKQKSCIKVHIFWEGHKILRDLKLTFECMYCCQK